LVRATDTVTRFGGDEFVVVLEDLGNRQAAPRLAQVIGERLSEPIDVGRGQIRIGASIGVALFPDHGDTPKTLLRAADAAMYEAKKTRTGAPAATAKAAKAAKRAASRA
jgi:diguanylate cyclase (GGDEF)-like protein